MTTIKEIIRLRFIEGRSKNDIVRSLHISRPTLLKYLSIYNDLIKSTQLEELIGKSDIELEDLFFRKKTTEDTEKIGKMKSQFPEVRRLLTKTGETLHRRWDAYNTLHPDGYEYSRFCYYYAEWNKAQKVWMHIDYKAGEKMLVDFTGEHLYLIDRMTREKIPVEVFVAMLGCSQLTFALAVPSQKKRDWIYANFEAFKYFGGITSAIVTDCLKSAVTKVDQYEPDINPEFADFAEYCKTTILPCRPGRPKDKALVEGMVKILYTRIFAVLRNEVFYELEDLNERILELLEEHNGTPFQKKDGTRRELFEELEQASLKPLPSNKFEPAEYAKGKVWFNYHIPLPVDNHFYSVPYRYAGKKVKIRYTRANVEIYRGCECIATHQRECGRGRYTTNKEHLPLDHSWQADWTPERIHAMAEKIGPETMKMTIAIMGQMQYAEQGFRSCMGLIGLNKKYETGRIERACRRAMVMGAWRYKTVQTILEKGLDLQPEPAVQMHLDLQHENIRGGSYYENQKQGEYI